MTFVVNPQTLSGEEAEKLFRYLEAMAESRQEWLTGSMERYFQDEDNTPFKLQHNIVIRPSKKPGGGLRYEFYGHMVLDKGSFGAVIPVDGTLKRTPDGFVFKTARYKSGATRVVKVQLHDERYWVDRAVHEQQMIVHAGYEGSKPPAWHPASKQSFIVMKTAPGKCLFDILVDIQDGKLKLSNERRLQVTIAILNAMKTHLEKPHIIHRDLTPENIMVDLDAPEPIVTIVDFGLSIDKEEVTVLISGKPSYCPPEQLDPGDIQTLKTDIFGIARSLLLLWGVPPGPSYTARLTIAQYLENARNPSMEGLFSNCEPMIEDAKAAIKAAFTGMLNPDWRERFNIDQSLRALQRVNFNVPNNLPSLKTLLHNLLFAPKPDNTPEVACSSSVEALVSG